MKSTLCYCGLKSVLLLFVGLVTGLPLNAATGEGADKLPNIVMIISDDQAWNDYSFMGHPDIKTPKLDKLARQSLTFTRGYVPTSLCRPSLATMITGLYPSQHFISGNDPAVPAGREGKKSPEYQALVSQLNSKIKTLDTLPRMLAEKGYVSHQSGKWWEGSHRDGGFTHGMTHGDPKRGGRHGDEGLKIGRQGLQPVFDFIEEAGEKPFFIWYAPFLPHTPHNPPQRLLDKYKQPDRPLALAKYYAMCEWFDETCGELVDHIDQKGLGENTLIVYVTDNGWIQKTELTDTPEGWRYGFAPGSKQAPSDGGIRTPIMLRWTGKIKPSMDKQTLVSSVDLAPTILAAAGIEKTTAMTGLSLMGLAEGKPLDRDVVFGEIFAHDIADLNDPAKSLVYRWCVSGKEKLILHLDGKTGRYGAIHKHMQGDRSPQLFDIMNDPFEKTDLHDQQADKAKSLEGTMSKFFDKVPAVY